jgi:transposase-like protein
MDMDAMWLKTQLASGRSIEAIARETGRDPSTVAYWVNKHGLVSTHAARHASRGGIDREDLAALVERGLSIRQIAAELGFSATTVRHWLRRYRLHTEPLNYSRRDAENAPAVLRECAFHGWTTFGRVGVEGHYRCRRCNAEAVTERRRRIKELLVVEAGGRCALCGFDDYAGALQFHHLDPSEKAFALSRDGVTRSVAAAREEAAKCALLCANCHAMVEAGLRALPKPADITGAGFGPG